MFEIGFWEMVLVGIVGLLVFGPEKLPRVARETALWVRKARSMVSSVKQEIDQELQVQDLRESLSKQRKALSNVTIDGLVDRLSVEEPQAPAESGQVDATPERPHVEEVRRDG
ncbi:Sec-independent protein translocase protein TatB [Methylotetracoccus oryzae]|uniref:Sec-independent protein translocase protein TatB n=1 Tax=Methylotetracoccus oryzae TaxID=1919059 RepID=UPI001118CBE9|nr:Sec-independent protein translocase protein TatB [Methylotetracoccus oryzae]